MAVMISWYIFRAAEAYKQSMQLTINFMLKPYFVGCIHANILFCYTKNIHKPTTAWSYKSPQSTGLRQSNFDMKTVFKIVMNESQPISSVWSTVRENVCNNSKKRKKSCFLDFEKRKKNVHIVSQAT